MHRARDGRVKSWRFGVVCSEVSYKVEVGEVHGGLLLAVVEDDEEGVDEVAGEADVRQRSPHTQRQQAVDQA